MRLKLRFLRSRIAAARSGRLAALLLAMTVPGCSDEGPPGAEPVFPVCGFVTHNGEPMSGAVITFHHRDSKRTSQGIADKDGVYYLTTYLTEDGAAAGEYAVTIYWPGESTASPDDPDPPLAPDRLHEEYASEKQSPLSASVHEEENTIDFLLP